MEKLTKTSTALFLALVAILFLIIQSTDHERETSLLHIAVTEFSPYYNKVFYQDYVRSKEFTNKDFLCFKPAAKAGVTWWMTASKWYTAFAVAVAISASVFLVGLLGLAIAHGDALRWTHQFLHNLTRFLEQYYPNPEHQRALAIASAQAQQAYENGLLAGAKSMKSADQVRYEDLQAEKNLSDQECYASRRTIRELREEKEQLKESLAREMGGMCNKCDKAKTWVLDSYERKYNDLMEKIYHEKKYSEGLELKLKESDLELRRRDKEIEAVNRSIVGLRGSQ